MPSPCRRRRCQGQHLGRQKPRVRQVRRFRQAGHRLLRGDAAGKVLEVPGYQTTFSKLFCSTALASTRWVGSSIKPMN